MKVFFLVLLIVKSPTGYYYLKIPFGYSLIPITCEEAFNKNINVIKNPNYETGNGQNWVILKYKDLVVGGHFCIDEHGNYYNGYEEKLNWELGH